MEEAGFSATALVRHRIPKTFGGGSRGCGREARSKQMLLLFIQQTQTHTTVLFSSLDYYSFLTNTNTRLTY